MIPYGFRLGEDDKLVVNESERSVVEQILMYRESGESLRAIVTRLSREGVVSRSGEPMQLTQVARIVSAVRGKNVQV
jgi:hypothetical protein